MCWKRNSKAGALGCLRLISQLQDFGERKIRRGFGLKTLKVARENICHKEPECAQKGWSNRCLGNSQKIWFFYDGANGVRSEEVPYKTIPNHTKTNKNHTKTNQTKPNQPKPSKPLFDQLRQFHNSRDVFVEGSVWGLTGTWCLPSSQVAETYCSTFKLSSKLLWVWFGKNHRSQKQWSWL